MQFCEYLQTGYKISNIKVCVPKVYVSVLLDIPWCWSYYIWERFIYITNETILAFAVFLEFERNGSKK